MDDADDFPTPPSQEQLLGYINKNAKGIVTNTTFLCIVCLAQTVLLALILWRLW